ncbi:MAG TPA: PKD domain-containing protein [Candidatus Nitrosotalea sp.]|nr:PKD domain-containing protein [Candidatus Nitrosotalea sp.]
MHPKILLFIPVFGVLLVVGDFQLSHGETPPTQPDDKSAMTITSFDAAPQSGNVPLVVKFTASVQVGPDNLPPLRWSYDFGDGNIAEDTANENISKMSSISHTYTKPGTYSAVLTVTDQGFNNIRSQTVVITVKSVTLFGENSQVSISDLTMVDASGHPISSFQVGQQIGVQSVLTNREAHDQRFAYVVEAMHGNGVLDYFEGSSAFIQSNQSLTAVQNWMPKEAGNYTVEVFIWDSLADAALLSDTMEKKITVQSSGDASMPPTSSIQKSSASTIWFKYTPICCDGTPWGNMYLNSSSALPDFMKITNYFNDHGITIIKSMQTYPNCNPCIEINEQPLDYSYYLLVSSSDEDKMLNLGFQKVDTIPSDAHSAGL